MISRILFGRISQEIMIFEVRQDGKAILSKAIKGFVVRINRYGKTEH
jgi:hypothetical protein